MGEQGLVMPNGGSFHENLFHGPCLPRYYYTCREPSSSLSAINIYRAFFAISPLEKNYFKNNFNKSKFTKMVLDLAMQASNQRHVDELGR